MQERHIFQLNIFIPSSDYNTVNHDCNKKMYCTIVPRRHLMERIRYPSYVELFPLDLFSFVYSFFLFSLQKYFLTWPFFLSSNYNTADYNWYITHGNLTTVLERKTKVKQIKVVENRVAVCKYELQLLPFHSSDGLTTREDFSLSNNRMLFTCLTDPLILLE